MNLIPGEYCGVQWGQLLQNMSEADHVDKPHGILLASTETFTIKIFCPSSDDDITLNLAQVIKITRQIFEKSSEDASKKRELGAGLKHLEWLVRSSIEKHNFYLKPSHIQSMDFYDEYHILIEQIDESPQSRIKKQILRLAQKEINAADVEKIREMTREDKNLLFDLTEYHENFFNLALEKPIFRRVLLPLLADVLMSLDNIEKNNIILVKNFIFNKSYYSSEPSFFELLMQTDEANEIFDSLLKFVNKKELNSDQNRKTQIFDFAHSMKRYEYIFLKVEDLNAEELEQANLCDQTEKINHSKQSNEELKGKNSQLYYAWLYKRMESSTTLADNQSPNSQTRFCRWVEAENLRSSYANEHKGTTTPFKWRFVQLMHYAMCKGEEGVQNPGEMRKDIVRTSGGWSHLYCPENYLLVNLRISMVWFNQGLISCEKKELNPIIFAAQTYQRFVSLHPFENGNGRISRLLMDYVLDRFNLPPPILGSDVLDAVFPMDRSKKHQNQYVNKMIIGIQQSKKFLDKK